MGMGEWVREYEDGSMREEREDGSVGRGACPHFYFLEFQVPFLPLQYPCSCAHAPIPSFLSPYSNPYAPVPTLPSPPYQLHAPINTLLSPTFNLLVNHSSTITATSILMTAY